MNKNILVGLVAVAALVLGGLAYAKVPTKVVGGTGAQGERGLAGKDGEKGPKGDRGDIGPSGPAGRDGKNSATQVLGSVSGPDTYFDYTANQNLQKWALTKGFTAATTTVCAIKSPAATSTLVFGGVNFTTSSTTASLVTLAKATTPFATTTIFNTLTLAASALGAQIATTSSSALGVVPSQIFSPSTYFVVGMQDTTPEGGAGTFSPVGSCSAEFVRI